MDAHVWLPVPSVALSYLAIFGATQSLSPNTAVILGTFGICLGFIEFNRPGRVVPGALGLLCALFAVAALRQAGLRPSAVLSLVCAALILLTNVWRRLPLWSLAAATATAIVGLRFLVSAESRPVRTAVAVLCGGVLGPLSAALSRVAYRARRLKAVD